MNSIAFIQFHWNNPEGVKDYVDASGMTYFYTEKLRQYDISGGVLGMYSNLMYLICYVCFFNIATNKSTKTIQNLNSDSCYELQPGC